MPINNNVIVTDKARPIILKGFSLAYLLSFYRIFALALVCTSAMLAGCATSAVVKEAKGQINTVDKIAVLKITDAYKDTTKNVVLICMEVRDLETNLESEMTLNISLQEPDRWHVYHPLGQGEEYIYSSQVPGPFAGTYVGFQPMARDLTHNCQGQGHQLPVFNIGVVMSPFGSKANNSKSSFNLPSGMSESVYTIHQDGFPANFGYISTSKIVSNANSIDIQADSMLDMRTVRNQKPYLYLLTPVTVVVDTVTITVSVVIAALYDPLTYVGIAKMSIGN